MTVWVALGGYNYEGFDEPIGVFSSEELARAACYGTDNDYDTTIVYEYVIDMPGTRGAPVPQSS